MFAYVVGVVLTLSPLFGCLGGFGVSVSVVFSTVEGVVIVVAGDSVEFAFCVVVFVFAVFY